MLQLPDLHVTITQGSPILNEACVRSFTNDQHPRLGHGIPSSRVVSSFEELRIPIGQFVEILPARMTLCFIEIPSVKEWGFGSPAKSKKVVTKCPVARLLRANTDTVDSILDGNSAESNVLPVLH